MLDNSPVWDLSDLYTDIDDKRIGSDISSCRKDSVLLQKQWEGKLDKATGAELAEVISRYEMIIERLGRVQSHAQLLFAANTADANIAKHHQSMREAGAEIGAQLLFV
mgnify:FL=1